MGCRNASTNGLAFLPPASTCMARVVVNSSDSSSWRRRMMATIARTRAIRNGMRQPHVMNHDCGPRPSAAINPADATLARPAPLIRKAPYRPCLPVGACSTTMVAAPPISPPTKKPCSIRKNSNSSGAAMPIDCTDGMSPMQAVAMPMPTTVIIRVTLRPMRSPIAPKTRPPMGRRKNPTANVANDDSWATTGSSPAKNTAGNTAADAKPYR